jgi:hypothetical protein
MVPWFELLTWPPKTGFENLVKETTRTITNFHLAYEGYTLNRMQLGEDSPYKDCLSQPQNYVTLPFHPKRQTPFQLAQVVIQASIQLAPEIGNSEYEFFGSQLKQQGVSMTAHPQMIDYQDYSIRPDLNEPRRSLTEGTCKALANASLASRLLIEWALQP